MHDSLFWCLVSPGLSSLLRSEAKHVGVCVYERCDSEKSASPSRSHSYSLSPLCKQCAVERLSIRREINAASPTEHALMSQSDFCPDTFTLFTGSLPGDKTAWRYLSGTLLLLSRFYLRIIKAAPQMCFLMCFKKWHLWLKAHISLCKSVTHLLK